MQVYIFDMDGTFLDSMDKWKSVLLEFLENRNIETSQEFLNKLNAMTVQEAIAYLIEEFDLESDLEKIKEEMTEIMANNYRNTVNIDPHVRDYFKYLKSKGKKLVLATASERYLVNIVLDRFGLEDTFDLEIVSDEVDLHKDSPDYFLNIADRFDIKADQAIVFEDSLYSIKSAIEAGMKIVSITFQSNENQLDQIRKLSDLSGENFGDIKDELRELV